NTPMTISACRGHLSICQLLLSRGAVGGAANCEGFTPLHLAAANGHTDCVEALIDAGMDVNGTPEDRVCTVSTNRARVPHPAKIVPTPTKLAFVHGQLHTFEYLIALGGTDADSAAE
ncbi:hypothetical protein FOZ63_023656, partial [Perkinsus olseni]